MGVGESTLFKVTVTASTPWLPSLVFWNPTGLKVASNLQLSHSLDLNAAPPLPWLHVDSRQPVAAPRTLPVPNKHRPLRWIPGPILFLREPPTTVACNRPGANVPPLEPRCWPRILDQTLSCVEMDFWSLVQSRYNHKKTPSSRLPVLASQCGALIPAEVALDSVNLRFEAQNYRHKVTTRTSTRLWVLLVCGMGASLRIEACSYCGSSPPPISTPLGLLESLKAFLGSLFEFCYSSVIPNQAFS